jgi:hypothetical protein
VRVSDPDLFSWEKRKEKKPTVGLGSQEELQATECGGKRSKFPGEGRALPGIEPSCSV